MKVRDLIRELKKLPQHESVWILTASAPRLAVNVVYESKGGPVILTDYNEPCYTDKGRPVGAPSTSDKQHWKTEAEPFDYDYNDDEIWD